MNVFRVIETPELSGETTLDQHIAEMNTLIEVKETVEQAAKEHIGFDQHGKCSL
jgi:hypothetical protein